VVKVVVRGTTRSLPADIEGGEWRTFEAIHIPPFTNPEVHVETESGRKWVEKYGLSHLDSWTYALSSEGLRSITSGDVIKERCAKGAHLKLVSER
jgi:hypothetical protein